MSNEHHAPKNPERFDLALRILRQLSATPDATITIRPTTTYPAKKPPEERFVADAVAPLCLLPVLSASPDEALEGMLGQFAWYLEAIGPMDEALHSAIGTPRLKHGELCNPVVSPTNAFDEKTDYAFDADGVRVRAAYRTALTKHRETCSDWRRFLSQDL